MFSLMRPKSALRASSTLLPPKGSAFSAARSAGLRLATSSAREAANFRKSSVLAELPCASTSAFLHSIIGASVLSRRSLTMLAVISAITWNLAALEVQKKGAAAPLLGRNRRSLPFRPGLFDFDELVGGCT